MAHPIARLASTLMLALTCGALPGTALAGFTPFTDRHAFEVALAALPGLRVTTENYDGQAAGTTIADAASLGTLTYTYSHSGNDLADSSISLQVATGSGTTSPTNYLGTSDGGVFQSGDDFMLSFGPARALGLYVISNDPLFDGDIALWAGGIAATLVAADEMPFALPDGKVFFLGLISDSSGFTSAEIRSYCSPCGTFLFNIDDVVVAQVPLPSSLPLALTAIVVAGIGSRRPRVFR